MVLRNSIKMKTILLSLVMVVSLIGDASALAIGAAAGAAPPTPLPRLTNISTRAFVQTEENVVIGGFIVQGSGVKRVIIRALGPELTQYGIMEALRNPTLELHDGAGTLIASNNNWGTTIIGGIITQNQVSDIRNSGYAPSDPLESAIIADLPPGNYTAIMQGVNQTIGVGLIEVYDLDDAGTVPSSFYTTSAVAVLFRRAIT